MQINIYVVNTNPQIYTYVNINTHMHTTYFSLYVFGRFFIPSAYFSVITELFSFRSFFLFLCVKVSSFWFKKGTDLKKTFFLFSKNKKTKCTLSLLVVLFGIFSCFLLLYCSLSYILHNTLKLFFAAAAAVVSSLFPLFSIFMPQQ